MGTEVIQFVRGNILTSEAEALVNPVNCLGVYGAGLAKQFAGVYPRQNRIYKKMCEAGRLHLGKVLFVPAVDDDPAIVYFPTKGSWRDLSSLAVVEYGLRDLRAVLNKEKVKSVAIPALGCGLGGLRWKDVKSLITEVFADAGIEVYAYEPR